MPDGFHPQIVIACEHDSDARVAKGFAERIMLERIDWFEDLDTNARPSWRGVLPNSDYLRWASIAELYKNERLPAVFGLRIDGQPPKLETVTTIKALRLAKRLNPLATVLMRDIDSQSERREGLLQGRDEYYRTTPGSSSMVVIIGTPDRYREAWLLAGFVPKFDRETEQLNDVRAGVGSFDPTIQPHRLRGAVGEPRCAKDIWGQLSDNNHTRETSCWSETPLEILHSRGVKCGLSDFLSEIETHLVAALK